MWSVLRLAHEDSSSGGQMHLLHRLITTQMDRDDVEAHINSLHRTFKQLDSLITVDEIFSTSILTSLPSDWLPVITPLMQWSSVDSATVIRAIRNEATRRKTSSNLVLTSEVVAACVNSISKNTTSTFSQPSKRNTKYCTHCERTNHKVQNCWVCQAEQENRLSSGSCRGASTSNGGGCQSSKSSCAPTKAGKTSVVSLKFSDDDSFGDVIEACSVKVALANTSSLINWNVDSGCLLTMTPHVWGLTDVRLVNKSIVLADSSSIDATHT